MLSAFDSPANKKVKSKLTRSYIVSAVSESYSLVICLRVRRSWPIEGATGSLSCKAAYIARDVSKLASVYTLVALSIDRCLASYPNLGHLRTFTVGKVVCVVVWASSVLLASPYAYLAHASRYDCLQSSGKYNKWSKDFDERLHRGSEWIRP